MSNNKKLALGHYCRLFSGGLALIALGACSALKPTATPNPNFYTLAAMPTDHRAGRPLATPTAAPTLMISPPHASAGYDSPRLIYVRAAQQLEYFAHSEWIDPPARLLAPLLVSAIEQTGAFGAVVLMPSTAAGDLRLDTEIIRLQQDFRTSPSQIHFTLRAYLIDENTRRVIAWREFNVALAARSDDPAGGVAAANRAVHSVLAELGSFCAAAVNEQLPHPTLKQALP
jgi:cholesterol transport system auxiliary component